MKTWITDKNNNRASIEFWGSEEAAQASLATLVNCSRCSDCSDSVPFTPVIEDIDKVVYAAASQPLALDMSDWHTCATMHCRAGWVVTLAGDAGKVLEDYYGTCLAAQLIYRESGAPINPCRFFDTDDKAMADMKRRAEAS